MRGFIEESSTMSREEKNIRLDAVEKYQEEQVDEEIERLAGDVSTELDSILGEMSTFSAFNGKLDGINGVLVEKEIGYEYYGEFDNELELDELVVLKDRAERAYNSSVGTQMERVAGVFKDTVNAVTLGYEEVLL